MTIDTDQLKAILLELVAEAYDGPLNPQRTWFVDNEAGSGVMGTLAGLSASQASKPFGPSDPASAATHAGHLRFALNLANRALRGEHVHASANWKESWKYGELDEKAWRELLDALRSEYDAFRATIEKELPFRNQSSLTGVIGQLAHGAWHLGALRQGLGLVSIPREQ